MASSSSTSSNQKSFKYHVFLSFRGEDTRKTFVDHLYASLKRLGIHTFRDNEELEKGKRIDELFNAIEESRFLIIVFSKNYASSSWCLKELTKIMECQDEKEQIAYPLFYDVEPTNIRKRSGPVGSAIARHKTNEEYKKWEKALESAGNLVGWELKEIANGHEAEAINIVVENILLKLRSIHLSNDDNLIGMERRMQDMESSLGIGLNDKARMIGIWGMGGIGKTTLARAIFDRVSFRFEGSSFVADVREVSEKKGLQSLQKQVLSDVSNVEHTRVENVYDGKRIMRIRLPYKKVLLVLDDVDDAKQLEALAGDWFKDGSRIIITTRDRKVLLEHGVNVNWIYDASLLSKEEAISLFNRYAFKRRIPDRGYEELSLKVVHYAAGLPLTIKVLGSHLHGENVVFWRDVLKRLEKIPWQKTLEVLEISYNSLEDDLKEIFLDVACFMTGLFKSKAVQLLDGCGFRATYGLRILEQKSLITILENKLGMHDRIEELAKNIVRRSHPHEPNKHSRLWIPEEIAELFSDDAGTEGSPCIGLKMMLRRAELSPENIMKCIGNMNKLRYLYLLGFLDVHFPNCKFDQSKRYFPNSLQSLHWQDYPFRSLPQTFLANNLVELELGGSIVQLWESGERKVLMKLKFLNLSRSKLRTLDLGMTPNLERLILIKCHDLTELHVPAGCLERLDFINLIGSPLFTSFSCIKQLESLGIFSLTWLRVEVLCLENRPRHSSNNLSNHRGFYYYHNYNQQPSSTRTRAKSVYLDLQPCTKLQSVSGSIARLQHIRRITFRGCILGVPNDLDQLKCLEWLTLHSTHIICLPDSVCLLKHLKSLSIIDCLYLEELPENLGWLQHLVELSLLSTSIRRLPDSICVLKQLLSLKLESCLLLQELPKDLGQLECLEKLSLLSTGIRLLPDSICMLKHLKSLNLEACQLLEKLPEDIGRLKCLEKLNLTECASLGEIPHSICLLKDLSIIGSEAVLQACAFATEMKTSETETFTQAVHNTGTGTVVVVGAGGGLVGDAGGDKSKSLREVKAVELHITSKY